MIERGPPPHVLDALETLERASAPGPLGPAYQALLDWRRNAPPRTRERSEIWNDLKSLVGAVVFAAILVAGLAVFDRAFPEGLSDYWNGFFAGAYAVILLILFTSLFRRPTREPHTPPLSIESRIDAAINRWRHLVPAMKEIPR